MATTTRRRGGNTPVVAVPACKLIEDGGLYPRVKVDDSHVSSIAEAIRAGYGDEIPPIVVWDRGPDDWPIVDGFHRRRAWVRVYGPQVEVPAKFLPYATEGEALEDAVRRNATHGRKLNSNDETRAALLMQGLGLTGEAIAAVLRIPPAKVEKLTVRVAVTELGTPVPLKRGDRHLAGRMVSEEQVAALGRRIGVPYARLARQLLDGLRQGLLPDDPGTWAALQELSDALAEALPPHLAEAAR